MFDMLRLNSNSFFHQYLEQILNDEKITTIYFSQFFNEDLLNASLEFSEKTKKITHTNGFQIEKELNRDNWEDLCDKVAKQVHDEELILSTYEEKSNWNKRPLRQA
jgi:hypothetical protein